MAEAQATRSDADEEEGLMIDMDKLEQQMDSEKFPSIYLSLLETEERMSSLGVNDDHPDASTAADQSETTVQVSDTDREVTMKYLRGEISFEQYTTLLAEGATKEEDILLGIAQEETETTLLPVEPSTSQASEKSQSKKLRRNKLHRKLPRHLQGLMGEANVNFARGQNEEAIKMCMEIVRSAPLAHEPFQTLGMIYEELGDMEKAVQFLLIAAHLNPSDPEEWGRLAEMSIELNHLEQAVGCYSKAVRYDPKNPAWLAARCDLHRKMGDFKRVMEGYHQILPILSKDQGIKYMELARELTRYHHTNGNISKAVHVLKEACEIHRKSVNPEDVNLLLELYMTQKSYMSCIQILVEYCGLQLHCADNTIIEAKPDKSVSELPEDMDLKQCIVPESLAVDLRSKLVVCLIHRKYFSVVDSVLNPLLSEDPEDLGDLHLDVAEAYMEQSHHTLAEPILKSLVHTTNYNLAAVWLRYAECLNNQGNLKAAVKAFQCVVELAPSHLSARVSLSALQQQLGHHKEALQALEHHKDSQNEPKIDLGLLLPKCSLLYSQKKYQEFIECAKQVIFSHFKDIFTDRNLTTILSNRSIKHRLGALRMLIGSDFEGMIRSSHTAMTDSSITVNDMWELYIRLCDVLVEIKDFIQLEKVSIAALAAPAFMSEPERAAEADFICLLACLMNMDGNFAYTFVRELCVKNMDKPQVWNLFGQVMALSQDIRHNRFCLRLMLKCPDHFALGLLNGHNAMVAGTYKHALGEYVNVFRQDPENPLTSLLIGITFIHMASQKFAGHRHSLTVQGCAFLNQYLELRGECQESFFNLGRAVHQLGLLPAAVYYYQRGLEFGPAVEREDNFFDLSRDIAFNLQLIYQQSGSKDLASMITQRYLVV